MKTFNIFAFDNDNSEMLRDTVTKERLDEIAKDAKKLSSTDGSLGVLDFGTYQVGYYPSNWARKDKFRKDVDG